MAVLIVGGVILTDALAACCRILLQSRMRNFSWRCRLVRSSVLSYFFLFTISTLSYTPVYEQLNKGFDDNAATEIRIPRLFLLELIGSEFANRSGSGDYPPPFRFIFLKKRAVLPVENPVKKSQSYALELIAHTIILPAGPAFVTSALYNAPLSYALLLSVHSGISPPYA